MAARDAAPERQAVAGQEAAEQVHAFGLRERCRLADHRPGQSETPGELVGHAPLQERPEGVAAMLVVLDVPGVDVVLAAGGQIEAVLGEPSKEGRGVLDLVAGMAATSWGDRLLLRADAKARQDFPGGEARTSWAWLRSVMSARWPTSHQGVTVNGAVNIVPANASAMAFGRTPGQVLNVVYLTPTTATSGGFSPNGVNGSLNSSGGSQMGTMPAGARPPAVAAPPGQDKGLLTAGGAALLAAGGIAAYATRQHTTANQDQAS